MKSLLGDEDLIFLLFNTLEAVDMSVKNPIVAVSVPTHTQHKITYSAICLVAVSLHWKKIFKNSKEDASNWSILHKEKIAE